MTTEINLPGADHPITIDAESVRVVARVGDTVIADTIAALTLREAGYPPVHYISLDDVVPGTLCPSRSHSYCPYKGDASYYNVALPDGTELRDVAWTYAARYPAVDAIAGRVPSTPTASRLKRRRRPQGCGHTSGSDDRLHARHRPDLSPEASRRRRHHQGAVQREVERCPAQSAFGRWRRRLRP